MWGPGSWGRGRKEESLKETGLQGQGPKQLLLPRPRAHACRLHLPFLAIDYPQCRVCWSSPVPACTATLSEVWGGRGAWKTPQAFERSKSSLERRHRLRSPASPASGALAAPQPGGGRGQCWSQNARSGKRFWRKQLFPRPWATSGSCTPSILKPWDGSPGRRGKEGLIPVIWAPRPPPPHPQETARGEGLRWLFALLRL